MLEQMKASPYWSLKEGDSLKGKKITKIIFFEDKYSGTHHLKLITMEGGSEYFLDEDGLNKVEKNVI